MTLEELRQQIDRVDEDIVSLVNERARIVQQIGEWKARSDDSIYKPHREREVYRHALEANEGPLCDRSVEAVFREIISGCIVLEKGLKIAYLGPSGTFTHAAARSQFGESVAYEPAPTLAGVFEEVERGRADYGVVPVENSSEGGIRETLARFIESPLKVSAEIVYEIHHSLLANCALEQINTVYSKGTVFRQTRRWLREHLPGVECREASSTGHAAELAASEEGAAAIGHARLAAAYGLDLLVGNIEDTSNNTTRFFVLGDHMSEPTGDDKTAILCSVKDKVGALHDLLAPFQTHGINMTKIESFPVPGATWQYYFFIDFLGHPDEAETQHALDTMSKECEEFRILGAFPRQNG